MTNTVAQSPQLRTRPRLVSHRTSHWNPHGAHGPQAEDPVDGRVQTWPPQQQPPNVEVQGASRHLGSSSEQCRSPPARRDSPTF